MGLPYPFSNVSEPADLDIEIIEPKEIREDIALKENYLDPDIGEQMHGKRRFVIKGDNVAVGVETGSNPP